MDFNLKQWRNNESENQESPAKLPRLHLDFHSVSAELPLFVSEPTTTTTTTKFLSDSTATATTKFPRMGSGYFSLAQWQELELQALIFRHFIAGAPVPHELLHLVKKSIITSSAPSYYFSNPYQQYPHYQQALMQSGYWGRAGMDPEPGRCRRTDGKKWRCSRDVVAGQKYCERHVHRGRSRSRKPVEIPTPVSNGANKNTTTTVSHQAFAKMAGHAAAPHFSLSGHSPTMDALHLNQRPSESTKKGPPLEAQKDVSGSDGKLSNGQILRHFFDDWPRQQQLQEGDNAATSLSISMPGGGNPSSDFSLKLSTGNDYDSGPQQVRNVERSTWRTSHQVASMGGPLAEALRSSTTSLSPTSVLHQLARGSTSEASYIST
ncbi:growth-regulating factor 3-like [Lycium barbarum]|uniref:growth-regulating factor 3-like n=1 Tax=Lycium barbarum TaxID=112863 RepID=UPI00293EC59F|nr:growth-regulating factor 3-like [Lycium barbarum]